MKRRTHRLVGLCCALALVANTLVVGIAAAAPANLTLHDIDGSAVLLAHDGTYLGKVSSTSYDADSICTSWGVHGSTWGAESVRTDWGVYGADWSAQSAYTTWTSTPPMIIYEKQIVGYLTKNTSLTGAVDPDVLFATYGCTR